MQLFPYILARIGGGSFENLTQGDYTPLMQKVESLLVQKIERNRLKETLCERLFTCIITLQDQKAQNLVQNVRRDIYNERPVRPQALASAKQHLPLQLVTELDEYFVFTTHMQADQENGAAIYNKLLQVARRHLQELARNEFLQKGLVLSSQSLLTAVSDYISKSPSGFTKKELKTEQSLLKYLTRMFSKTSPFSTFNNLSLGTLSYLPEEIIQIRSTTTDAPPITGHIRLNNYLFKFLKDLFTSSPEVYRHLILRPNPTVENKGDHLVFLTNNNNIEAFQRIPATPVVSLLFRLACANGTGIRFAALVQETCEYVDAPEEKVEEYLTQLIKYGFLEFDLGVSGTDPDWDVKLRDQLQYLEQQHVTHISELTSTLQSVRALAAKYNECGPAARQLILNKAYYAFRATYLKLHESAGLPEHERKTLEELEAERAARQKETLSKKKLDNHQLEEEVLVAEAESETTPESNQISFEHRSSTYFSLRPEQLFYEDTVRGVDVQFDDEKLKTLTKTLFNLLQELRLFSGMAQEREQMADYFSSKYGADARVNLLNFYEDFYREIKKPEAEWLAKNSKDPSGKINKVTQESEIGHDPDPVMLASFQNKDSGTTLRGEKMNSWLEGFVSAVKVENNEITNHVDFSLDLIRKLTERGLDLENEQTLPNSYSTFLQLYREKDEEGEWQLKGVLNASMPGYGKMISRFLHIFPEEVTQSLKTWNLNLQGEDSLFVEDCDASYFNANLHPPLMPYEIRMPGSHNSLPVERQLPISDFEVMINRSGEELQLVHKTTGKPAYVFDLGFQGKGGRSQLFQLLDKFTKAEYLFVQPIVKAVNTAVENESTLLNDDSDAGGHPAKKITLRPRLVYEDQLVIQRKGWHVPKELILQRSPEMSGWSYYFALNEWRKMQGIVDEVYVTILPNRNNTGLSPELMKKLGRDDYKPQYINFNDPLLVTLFEKLLSKVPATMMIEEMLPDSKDLLQINGQRFVTEFLVQWYC